MYAGHSLTSVQNFTEIVPGEFLRRGFKRKSGSKIERCHVRVSHLLMCFLSYMAVSSLVYFARQSLQLFSDISNTDDDTDDNDDVGVCGKCFKFKTVVKELQKCGEYSRHRQSIQ